MIGQKHNQGSARRQERKKLLAALSRANRRARKAESRRAILARVPDIAGMVLLEMDRSGDPVRKRGLLPRVEVSRHRYSAHDGRAIKLGRDALRISTGLLVETIAHELAHFYDAMLDRGETYYSYEAVGFEKYKAQRCEVLARRIGDAVRGKFQP